MKVFLKAQTPITDVWGEGKVKPVTYRLLTYLVTAEVEEGTLVHNCVSGELVLLEGEEAQGLASLPCAYAPWMDTLIQKHFLVPEADDDAQTVQTLRKVFTLCNEKNALTQYTILPTTNCNARCFYCYESGITHENMSDETADKAVDFIASHCGGEEVNINWFGGEPLLGVRQIDRICKGLREKGVKFASSMISNGYYFDEALIARAKTDWNFYHVQITIDGTEEVYNRTKAYVDACENPFERVLHNVDCLLANGISVYIRINLGLHNGEDNEKLLRFLIERFPESENLTIYPHVINENCGFVPSQYSQDESAMLEERKEQIEEFLREKGYFFPIEYPNLRTFYCMADRDDSCLISPSGKLGKCEHFIEETYIGNLDEDITDEAKWLRCKETAMMPHCKVCPIYPHCIHLKICETEKACSYAKAQLMRRYLKRLLVYCYEKDFLHSLSSEGKP